LHAILQPNKKNAQVVDLFDLASLQVLVTDWELFLKNRPKVESVGMWARRRASFGNCLIPEFHLPRAMNSRLAEWFGKSSPRVGILLHGDRTGTPELRLLRYFSIPNMD